MLSYVLITRVREGRPNARFGSSHFLLAQFIEFLTAFLSNSLRSVFNFMISIFLLVSFLASPLLFCVPQNSAIVSGATTLHELLGCRVGCGLGPRGGAAQRGGEREKQGEAVVNETPRRRDRFLP